METTEVIEAFLGEANQIIEANGQRNTILVSTTFLPRLLPTQHH